ncbi:hypothetical protein [Deinococcus kurensis]|uniref:hypothetical protein n=1 Tax=Deinococcus kurensis TaxID=2662757 RepID=UPI0012D359A7|nr:hypothetical protein [Deinococcus kurensis]
MTSNEAKLLEMALQLGLYGLYPERDGQLFVLSAHKAKLGTIHQLAQKVQHERHLAEAAERVQKSAASGEPLGSGAGTHLA